MPQNRYASDIAKNNSASTVFLNRVQNINDVATGRSIGIIGLSGYTGEANQVVVAVGEQNTDPLVLSTVIASYYPPPSAAVPISGSMSFDGNAEGTTYLSVANDADLRMGTGDFTIEWFQRMTFNRNAPRIFQIGTYTGGTVSIGVSIEGSSSNAIFYVWRNGSARTVGNIGLTANNRWIHCAIVKRGGTITVYINGAVFGTPFSDSTNFNDSVNPLSIGAENPTNESDKEVVGYTGLITNFRWTKGTAVYTEPFTVPAAPLTALANTKLLLLASTSGGLITDSSTAAKTVVNNGNAVTWSATNPF